PRVRPPPRDAPHEARVTRVAAYGLVALACFAVHAGRFALRREAHEIFWICTLGTLAVGGGAVIGVRAIVAVGFSWLAYGTPLWLAYAIARRELLPTSLLTHVGGTVLGALALVDLGFAPGAWWKASLGAIGVLAITRVATPRAANVNLAF